MITKEFEFKVTISVTATWNEQDYPGCKRAKEEALEGACMMIWDGNQDVSDLPQASGSKVYEMWANAEFENR